MRRIGLLPVGVLALLGLGLLAYLAGWCEAGLLFPHPRHTDIECATCHPGAQESESGAESLLPDADACLACHEQTDLEGWDWAVPSPAPSGFPGFSHAKHLDMESVDCAHCHGALSQPVMTGTGKGEPGHDLCFACHEGEKASAECASCHADVDALQPLSHGPDFRKTHSYEARGNGDACAECHRHSETCSECHSGENVLFLTHARNYLFTHAQDARKHVSDCASCHDYESFCVDCHDAMAGDFGLKPANHSKDWTTGRNLHAIEARRDISHCASCHEGDLSPCVICHSDRPGPRGGDRNIHPSGFADYDAHGPWHDDDTYYCFDCHDGSGAAEGSDGFCGYCHAPPRRD